MRAIVTGMIATYPVGGVAWDYGQYALGLERLDWEVWYLEDTGVPAYAVDPATGEYREDPEPGVRFLERALTTLSPALGRRWHVRDVAGRTYGLSPAALAEVVAGADLFLNVSGACVLRDEYRGPAPSVFVDTDPGWNHFVIFPRWDAKPLAERGWGYRGHDHFFTYAGRLGRPGCDLPDLGLPWQATRPPVVLDRWRPRPPGDAWTTVMVWNNYLDEGTPSHGGVAYGAKEREFARVEALPRRAPARFEVAVKGKAPRARWRDLGWSVRDGYRTTAEPEQYRAFVEGSRGEFAVAKNVYVATGSGWFSCRSVCYLAAGRPVVLQDTGYADLLPTGCGLLPFRDLDGAAAAVAAVERDYAAHAAAARALAREHFAAERVLGELLERIGLG